MKNYYVNVKNQGSVCPEQSGITYVQTQPFVFTPKDGTTPISGDSQWHYQNGTYDRVNPLYPISYAQLDYSATQADVRGTPATGTLSTDLVSPTILKENNYFGNKFRFTDSIGNHSDVSVGTDLWAHINWVDHSFTGAISDYVIDHLTGYGYMVRFLTDDGKYKMNTSTPSESDSWSGWISRINSLSFGGFDDWLPLDACSLRPHYNRVSLYEGATSSGPGWAFNFFAFARISGGPEGQTDNRGTMMTGENADSTNFWVLNDSGNSIEMATLVKTGNSTFAATITNIFPIRKHY